MVSFNPTTIYSMDPLKTGLPGLSTFPRSQPITEPYSGGNTMSFSGDQVIEDAKKKIRKPYTITKSRESWTEHEHDKFLEALQLFDRDWKKIEAFVGSKNVIQIRSHAQKYFLKVQKNGTNEHVPPPRPKRKAAHPYPQKASKTAETVVSRIAQPFQAASALTEHSYACQPDSPSVLRNPVNSGNLPSWGSSTVPPVVMSQVNRDDGGYVGSPIMYNCCYGSSNESTPRAWQADQWDQLKRMRAMPDFAQVYNFIGSVFDPNASGHLKRLKHMDPINMETAVLLMRNLSVNLTSPEFENHRRLLAAHVQAEGKCSTPCRSSASDNKPGCVVPAM